MLDGSVSLQFLSVKDGDVLFEVADGTLKDGALCLPIRLRAVGGATVLVNGIQAVEVEPGLYQVSISLRCYRNEVMAECMQTGERTSVLLFWLRGAYRTYALGVDDVILCLKNIWRNQDRYPSLFDDPFLAVYRDLHEAYGTRVHMHVYYKTVEGDFDLSMFPDKYKEEFRRNADWLRFCFHALCDEPDSPYKNASYEQVMREGELVQRELIRFAGGEVSDRFTSQHWADSALPGTRAFRDLGFSALDAYFVFDENGAPQVSYYLNAEQARHAATRDLWIDTKENIVFVKDDVILNSHRPDRIEELLNAALQRTDHALMYLLIHEQYFYPDYKNYLPDYRERLFCGVEWCVRNGYRSVWVDDVAFENDGFADGETS